MNISLATLRAGLAGYKTYIIIVLMMLTTLLEQNGVITNTTADQWLNYMMYGGGVALVAKLNRFGKSSEKPPA